MLVKSVWPPGKPDMTTLPSPRLGRTPKPGVVPPSPWLGPWLGDSWLKQFPITSPKRPRRNHILNLAEEGSEISFSIIHSIQWRHHRAYQRTVEAFTRNNLVYS